MSRKLLSAEQDSFLRSIAEGRSVKECTDLLNNEFGTTYTLAQIRGYKSNHSIVSGKKPWEFTDRSQTRLLTDEQHKWLVENVKGISNEEITKRLNEKFGTMFHMAQIKSYKNNHGISSGLTGHFTKGQIPANKGKKMPEHLYEKAKATMFKKGQMPSHTDPIGTEKMLADGFVWVKVDDVLKAKKQVNWKQKHVLLWEQANGKIPENHIIIFLDGNRENFDLDNLKMISKATNVRLNQNHLRYKEKELTEAGIAVAELITMTASAKRRKDGKKHGNKRTSSKSV